MGSHKNVIEINGKLYDAKSGTLLAQQATTPKKNHSTVDGFVKSTHHRTQTQTSSANSIRPAKPATRRHPAPAAKHRTTQKSQILMRSVVKKPAAAKPLTEVHSLSKKKSTIDHRLRRAQTIPRSTFVNKYGTLAHHQSVQRRTEALVVKEAPTHLTHSKSAVRKPAITQQHHSRPTPSPQPQTKSEELFNQALQKAETPKLTKKHKKVGKSRLNSSVTKWGASVAAAVLLVGFIAYMNLPNLSMQLASSRAGFDASMPGYQPSGFAPESDVSYKPGQITVSFRSNTDERNYKVTQAVSSWNSEALQENFLNAQNKSFQTTQDSGRTIYMYDNGNATWVNGGVWYQVESNQALSSDQLLKIASSL